jgi:FixJ family two-component response regulator
MQPFGYVAIVDDDLSTRQAIARLLRRHGINAESYPSARAFLAVLPSAMPDCFVVDVNMPDMSGLDLQRELQMRGVHIPTIVITANADENVASSATSLGAATRLPKPLAREALMAAIKSAVKKWN